MLKTLKDYPTHLLPKEIEIKKGVHTSINKEKFTIYKLFGKTFKGGWLLIDEHYNLEKLINKHGLRELYKNFKTGTGK